MTEEKKYIRFAVSSTVIMLFVLEFLAVFLNTRIEGREPYFLEQTLAWMWVFVPPVFVLVSSLVYRIKFFNVSKSFKRSFIFFGWFVLAKLLFGLYMFFQLTGTGWEQQLWYPLVAVYLVIVGGLNLLALLILNFIYKYILKRI